MGIKVGSFVPLNFVPDLDPNWAITQGAVVSMANYVPSKRATYLNFACGSNQAFESGLSYAVATYGQPLTGYVFKKVVSGGRMFIASKTKIVELTAASTVTDRSKGAGSYSSSTTQWTMTAQGNVVLAVNYYDASQVSASGAAFADLGGGSPKAQLIASNVNFVMMANYDDGSNQYGDGWWCSGLGNYATWTASLTTQAANGRLLDTPGPIKALVPLRDAFIAYKDDSIYLGDYVGDTINGIIFSWKLISDKIGCSSAHGVAVLNDKHYFAHKTGIYAFDGATVTNVSSGINNWLVGASNWFTDVSQLNKVQACVDETQGIVFFFASHAGTSVLDSGPCYNVLSDRWGFTGGTAGARVFQGSGGQCYAVLHATVADLIAWDSTLTSQFDTSQVLIGSDDSGTTVKLRRPRYGVAPPTSSDGSSFTLGTLGNGEVNLSVSRLRPRLLAYTGEVTAPTFSASGYRDEAANQPEGAITGSWNATDMCIDCTGESRYWQAGALALCAGNEVAGLAIDTRSGGFE